MCIESYIIGRHIIITKIINSKHPLSISSMSIDAQNDTSATTSPLSASQPTSQKIYSLHTLVLFFELSYLSGDNAQAESEEPRAHRPPLS